MKNQKMIEIYIKLILLVILSIILINLRIDTNRNNIKYYKELNNYNQKRESYAPLNPNNCNNSNNIKWNIYNITSFNDINKINTSKLSFILKDKKVSILGDSISTFEGYSNNDIDTNDTIGDNKIYYNGNNYITDVNDTWWMKTANKIGFEILVNNSWSGDKVIQRGQKRCLELHDNTGDNAGTNPDIIAVYLGINDFRHNFTSEIFKENYDNMIKNMIHKYSEADIFLFNFVPNNSNKRTIEELEEYNEVVKEIAEKYNCTLVDLYRNTGIDEISMYSYMGDPSALHPNVKGMQAISDVLIDSLISKYVYNN